MKKNDPSATAEFEQLLDGAEQPNYLLRLYVTGTTPRSSRAIRNIKKICQEELEGRYDLEVIDIYQRPVLAAGDQIVAAPTLIKRLPAPVRRFIGDLSNKQKVLLGLDLRPTKAPATGRSSEINDGRDDPI